MKPSSVESLACLWSLRLQRRLPSFQAVEQAKFVLYYGNEFGSSTANNRFRRTTLTACVSAALDV